MAVPDGRELASRVLAAGQSINAGITEFLPSKSDARGQFEARLGRARPDLDALRLRVDDLLRSAATHLKHNLVVKSERFAGLELRLKSVSPRDTLRRGYAIVQRRENGAVIGDASEVGTGDLLQVTVSRGGFEVEVTTVRQQEDGNG